MTKLEENILFHITFTKFIVMKCDFREIIVYEMLQRGYTQKEIAEKFECTERSIRSVVSGLKSKIQDFLDG